MSCVCEYNVTHAFRLLMNLSPSTEFLRCEVKKYVFFDIHIVLFHGPHALYCTLAMLLRLTFRK